LQKFAGTPVSVELWIVWNHRILIVLRATFQWSNCFTIYGLRTTPRARDSSGKPASQLLAREYEKYLRLPKPAAAEDGLVYPDQEKNRQYIGVRLYPNPVTHKTVHFESLFSTDLSVFDAQGRLLFHRSGLKGKQNLEMPMQPGFYFLDCVNALGKSRQKLMVK